MADILEPYYVCQFSCGAASAIATKMTLAQKPKDRVLIVNAFLQEEHEDNRRFLADCEKWFGHPVTVLRDEKYGASTDEVWRRNRFIKGLHGAPCSRILKRDLLNGISRPQDIAVIGFTVEESDRASDLEDHFPDVRWEFPLIKARLSHDDCLTMCHDAGLVLPVLYRMGYSNANCIGCPKGGQAYWQNIREDFPTRFDSVKAIQEEIGPSANFLRFRSGPRKGERMPLSQLPPGRGDMRKEQGFSCSFACDLMERELGIKESDL